MPIYEFRCPADGVHDIFVRKLQASKTHKCPTCKREVPNMISAPSFINIVRDWNEQANDYRRNPYVQAKAQLHNLDREQQEHTDASPMKITEEAIQATAENIDRSNKQPEDETRVPRRTKRIQDKLRKKKKKGE